MRPDRISKSDIGKNPWIRKIEGQANAFVMLADKEGWRSYRDTSKSVGEKNSRRSHAISACGLPPTPGTMRITCS